MRYFIVLDKNAVVRGKITADDDHPEAIEVEDYLYNAAKLGGNTYVNGKLAPYKDPVIPPYGPKVYTGIDAIDAMSKNTANHPSVDQRDIARISVASDVRSVKSKLKRVADANGITIAALIPGIPLD